MGGEDAHLRHRLAVAPALPVFPPGARSDTHFTAAVNVNYSAVFTHLPPTQSPHNAAPIPGYFGGSMKPTALSPLDTGCRV